jgi:putative transposase
MSRSRHTEAQMIGALKQLEAGRKVEDVAREVGVSKHTIYAWKAKYGGMEVSQAQEAKQLRDENTRTGGPLKPGFGLSGAVRPLVRVFASSIPTRSLLSLTAG